MVQEKGLGFFRNYLSPPPGLEEGFGREPRAYALG